MLGVLGGMGPMATVDFMRNVVEQTAGGRDQDHIPMLVYSACEIPDRTAAILENGPDPFPFMAEAIKRLDAGGASVIAIPCNTAHYWYDRLRAVTQTPILHIVEAVVQELKRTGVKGGRIGLLATDGTVQAQIYQKKLTVCGYVCLVPERQSQVMKAIRLVKAGQIAAARFYFQQEAQALLDRGCERVILGCTEIPIALEPDTDEEFAREQPLHAQLMNATQALARASIAQARTSEKASLVKRFSSI